MNKKKIILISTVAIVFSILGYFTGVSYTKYKMQAQLEEIIASFNTDNQKQTDTTVKNDKKDKKTVALNQEEKLANSSLKVLNVKEEESVSNNSGDTTSSGKFIIIELELTNNYSEALSYGANEFRLINDSKAYEIDDVAFSTMGNLNMQETIYNKNNDFIGVYDKFNPGITKKTYIVFDVPKDISLDNAKLITTNNKNIEFSLK